jgi:hypothetical protein
MHAPVICERRFLKSAIGWPSEPHALPGSLPVPMSREYVRMWSSCAPSAPDGPEGVYTSVLLRLPHSVGAFDSASLASGVNSASAGGSLALSFVAAPIVTVASAAFSFSSSAAGSPSTGVTAAALPCAEAPEPAAISSARSRSTSVHSHARSRSLSDGTSSDAPSPAAATSEHSFAVTPSSGSAEGYEISAHAHGNTKEADGPSLARSSPGRSSSVASRCSYEMIGVALGWAPSAVPLPSPALALPHPPFSRHVLADPTRRPCRRSAESLAVSTRRL